MKNELLLMLRRYIIGCSKTGVDKADTELKIHLSNEHYPPAESHLRHKASAKYGATDVELE